MNNKSKYNQEASLIQNEEIIRIKSIMGILNESVLMEQAVPLLTVLANPAYVNMGAADNSNIIYLTQRNQQGQPVPNSKYSYEIGGKYGFVGFDIKLRKVRRAPNGDLLAEALPTSGAIQGLLKKLIPKESKTPDNWLIVRVPNAKLNEAFKQLRDNKGSKATLDAGGGIKVTLELIP